MIFIHLIWLPAVNDTHFFPVFRKEPLNPPVSMKPLYWTRIVVPVTVSTTVVPETSNTSASTGTPPPLWEKLEEAKIEDMDAFTSLFSRQVIERKPTKKKTEKPSKQQVNFALTLFVCYY